MGYYSFIMFDCSFKANLPAWYEITGPRTGRTARIFEQWMNRMVQLKIQTAQREQKTTVSMTDDELYGLVNSYNTQCRCLGLPWMKPIDGEL